MALEQALHDEVGPVPLGIVLRMIHLFQDDGFLFVKVRLAQREIEQDLLLVAEREVGVFRGQGDLEDDQILPRVGVIVGAVAPDISADLGRGPSGGAAEEEAMLEEVDDAVGFGGFILGPEVDRRRDTDERQAMLLIEGNAKPVFEDEGSARILFLGSGGEAGQREQDENGEQRPDPPGLVKSGHRLSQVQLLYQFITTPPLPPGPLLTGENGRRDVPPEPGRPRSGGLV